MASVSSLNRFARAAPWSTRPGATAREPQAMIRSISERPFGAQQEPLADARRPSACAGDGRDDGFALRSLLFSEQQIR